MSEILEQMEDATKVIYDKGYNRMRKAVIDTFEDALEAKPEISARELYELMNKHELLKENFT